MKKVSSQKIVLGKVTIARLSADRQSLLLGGAKDNTKSTWHPASGNTHKPSRMCALDGGSLKCSVYCG